MKKELEIKDVMVGDWVDVRNDAVPNTPHIERITPSHFLRDEHWYGVELVPEILEKNGFERAPQISDVEPFDEDEDGNKHYSYNKTFWGWFQPDNIFCIPANGMGWLYIKYVHQLQHAFSLVGINKDFIL